MDSYSTYYFVSYLFSLNIVSVRFIYIVEFALFIDVFYDYTLYIFKSICISFLMLL